MHLRSVVEYATLISAHSPLLIERRTRLPREALARFWCAQRVRARMLIAMGDALWGHADKSDACFAAPGRVRGEPLLADALAGELLTRVWGAVLAAADRHANVVWGAPVAVSLVTCQQSVRQMVLRQLHNGPGVPPAEHASLDRMRRRIERWTDLLVGRLVQQYDLPDFAFDVERARDFGREQIDTGARPWKAGVWSLYLVSLRSAFPETELPGGRLGDLRREMIQSMFVGFEDEAFDMAGTLRSPHSLPQFAADGTLAAPGDAGEKRPADQR